MVKLKDYQRKAVSELKNGSVLCGGVGSGKSLTSLFYYWEKECQGKVGIEMKTPKDLYIITTAMKRDKHEWDAECAKVSLCSNCYDNVWGVNVVIDSWNNIKKYQKKYSSFFIFDEQRLVGSGVWVKSFLDIARKNHWILLSATPGDDWSDYIPVFVANGFYKNKTDFSNRHCVYARFSKYPKIERYVGIKVLESNLDKIMVRMKDMRDTIRHEIKIICQYDNKLYKTVSKDRWNPYDNEPIAETGKLCYLLRKVVNSDRSRIKNLSNVLSECTSKLIVFYNFDYELLIIKEYLDENKYTYSEWNGHKHESIPHTDKWIYLVQYSAGSEGWNCTDTNVILMFSQNYSYRITEQAFGRIDRIDTPFTDLYCYKFLSDAPIDVAITSALTEKRNFNERNFEMRCKIYE